MFSTIFHELRNHLEFHLSCRNSGIQDPPIFFFFFLFSPKKSSYFHLSMDPSFHKWVKTHDASTPTSPILHYTFLPKGSLSRSYRFPTNGYRACLISWLPLSHLELSLHRMLYRCCTVWTFFFFFLSIIIPTIPHRNYVSRWIIERWIRFKDLLKLYNDAIKVRKRNNGKCEFKKRYNKMNKFNNLLAK